MMKPTQDELDKLDSELAALAARSQRLARLFVAGDRLRDLLSLNALDEEVITSASREREEAKDA